METRKPSSPPIVVVGIIAAVVITAILIWRTDWFQQRIFPENYWTQRVAKLESSVQAQEFVIEHLRLELAKKTLTAIIEVSQKVKIATEVGMDTRKAAKEAADEVKAEILALKDLIKISEETLEEMKVELDRARSELTKHK